MRTVTSKGGTRITFDRTGQGLASDKEDKYAIAL